MQQAPCQYLEDYLARELQESERAEFLAHLAACPSCRQSVEEQTWVDSLVRQATTQLEPVPSGLCEGIDRRISSQRRRRVVRWVASVAAASLLLGIVFGLLAPRTPRQDTLPVVEKLSPEKPKKREQPPLPEDPSAPPPVQVTFRSQPEVIAIPVKTENPNITFIWVHPTVKNEQPPTHVSFVTVNP